MESVHKEPGLYFAYSSIPAGHEKKFEWIHQQGGNCGHFEVPTLYYRLKTEEELKKDKIFVSEIKCDTIVATFGDMCYHDRFPKSLHQFFDFTIVSRSDDKIEKRVNITEFNNLSFGNYYKKNIMRNNTPLNL